MSSGVGVANDVVERYNELKTGRKFKYVFFKLNDDNSEIVVDRLGQASSTYDDFVNELKSLTDPNDCCRYAVFDFEWETSDAGKRNKLCFYVWCPDVSKMKKKMLYASSKDAIRKKLVGIATEIQGTDFSEVDYDTILEKVSRGAGNQ